MGTKLELVWPGKYDRFALVRDEATGKPVQVPYESIQPRILIEQECYGDPAAGNLLINGENLFALKTLLASGYADQVKLIYIDPPYNTGNAFAHYEDGIEHSLWLTMMRDRLELLRNLLRPDGSIWVQLDDNEAHYCRVLMDEVFGRRNFVTNAIWQKVYSPKNSAKHFSAMHDHILVYAKDIDRWQINHLPRDEKQDQAYKNSDEDPKGPWKPVDLSARNFYSLGTYPITTPSGRVIAGPPRGRYWAVSRATFEDLQENNEIWWGVNKDAIPQRKRYLSEVKQGVVPQTIWFYNEVGHTQDAKKEVLGLFPDEAEVFATAKPERLMQRVIEIGSNEGDLVLDCFLGTGSTAATAHKMGRRWVGVEGGDHASSLCLPRLKAVTDGRDQGGISQAVGWTGGSGFRYYLLGKALIEQDAELGIWRLNYDNGKLIESICLQEGFKLCADGVRHGVKGRHFAHITEQFVTQEYLDVLASSLTEDEALTIYYLKAARKLQAPSNVVTKRIPQALLGGNQ